MPRCLNREEIFVESADQVQEGLQTSRAERHEIESPMSHANPFTISLSFILLLVQWV